MDRKALLIGNGGSPGKEHYLPGVEKDLANYKAFLESALGGAWRSDEIITLRAPTKAEVTNQIHLLKDADYSFVVFSGHGGHSTSSGTTTVEISPGVELDSTVLRTGAPKHTLILDCCRVISKELVADSITAMAKSAGPTLSRTDCRTYFDKRISECANGLIVIHACGLNETAGDTSRGGRYSLALIEGVKNWHSNSRTDTSTNFSIQSIVASHDDCISSVKAQSGNRQNPEIEKPRSAPHFPFAIVA